MELAAAARSIRDSISSRACFCCSGVKTAAMALNSSSIASRHLSLQRGMLFRLAGKSLGNLLALLRCEAQLIGRCFQPFSQRGTRYCESGQSRRCGLLGLLHSIFGEFLHLVTLLRRQN